MNHNKEDYYKKSILEIIYRLPREFEGYVNDKLINEKGMNFDVALLSEVSNIEVYYTQLSLIYNKIAFKITPADMINAENEAKKKHLTKQKETYDKDSIRNYQKYLIEIGLLNQFTIAPPKPKIVSQPKNRKPRKIASPDKVHLFKDENRKFAKTTIDLKYSMDKVFLDKRHKEYIYKIYDHTKKKYLSNDNGEELNITSYKEAREIIKAQYMSRKRK